MRKFALLLIIVKSHIKCNRFPQNTSLFFGIFRGSPKSARSCRDFPLKISAQLSGTAAHEIMRILKILCDGGQVNLLP